MFTKKGMKRKIALTLGLSLFLAACGNEDSTANGKDVTLTYSIWDAIQEPGMQAIADAFEEENPEIKVNVEVTPWEQYWTKLESSAQGGSMPDVFWMHSNEIANYSEGNVLMDLSETFENSENVSIEQFPEELVELYSAEDKLLGVPKDYDTIGLWYNKALFDEAGIEYPDGNWTWDDLLVAAQELTDEEAGVYGILAPLNRQEGYHNFIYQNDGYVISEDKTESGFRNEETVEAVQWYADLSVKHNVSPTQNQFADNSNLTFFQSGRGAMAFFGSWMTAEMANNEYTAENVDVAPLPQGEKQATIFNGLANSVAENTEYPQEAQKFVEFLSSEKAMKIQGENGSAIPALEGIDTTFNEAYPEFNTQIFIDQMEYGVIKPYTNQTTRWENIENEQLIPVFAGEKSTDEVAEDIADQVEDILADE
ncbi:ABC transporter substrate-binding protein [Carnobacterium sp. FSL W8-0810]|uniref:ABC transporter substrate-binding protein n=1 Tax=Carnobacterium sp. FSL W8-0810 TaxID=2954705 RepID=UPI0030F99F50